MMKLAEVTGVNVDTAMCYARVITFDFATNGISVPFFRQNQKNVQLINVILFTGIWEKAAQLMSSLFCVFQLHE